ncbi:MAG: hypothetical protein R3B53_01090 [Candidatus Paceibacterota bacterium]
MIDYRIDRWQTSVGNSASAEQDSKADELLADRGIGADYECRQ